MATCAKRPLVEASYIRSSIPATPAIADAITTRLTASPIHT